VLILGINAYHAEASAALIQDGRLIAAAEEERFSRIKHVAGFPAEAIRYCLQAGGVTPGQLSGIALSRNPAAHPAVKLKAALRRGLFSAGVRDRAAALARIRSLRETLAETLGVSASTLTAPIHFIEHHQAHIASSYYPSGWEEAVVLSLDGFGDGLSGLWGIGQGNRFRIDGGAPFPHSLGVLYTAITQFLGFHAWGDEYKVMGLAPYGDPSPFRPAFRELVREDIRSGYRLAAVPFRHAEGGTSMSWAAGAPRLDLLFSKQMSERLGPPREPAAPLEKRHADIAAALQERLETVVLALLNRLAERHRIPRLCYAGGVALNCTLNGKIRGATPFRDIFIQPAAYDAGTALGAALWVAHHLKNQPRNFVMRHAAWGPGPEPAAMERALTEAKLPHRRLDPTALCRTAAEALAAGKIIGWFQGRMEFGPRALGHRSLLADPRDPGMKEKINERIKRRENFRPFAPSILAERLTDYFPQAHPDPFMLFTFEARADQAPKIPAVVHVNGTGRTQAVDQENEPLYWELLRAFEAKTGLPMLLNTSFNEQEPIVCRPEEAIACFRRNGVDALALGPFWIVPGENGR